MQERKRIPLGEIVPDQTMLDRIMYRAQADAEIHQRYAGGDYSPVYPDEKLVDFDKDPEVVYARTIFDPATEVKAAARVRATLHSTVTGALNHAIADWQEKFPHITAQEVVELTKHSSFSNINVREAILKAHGIRGTDHDTLSPRHASYAAKALETYRAELATQQIAPGLLDVPSYQPQRSVLGCMAGCYSMIFKAIAGYTLKAPDQVAMTKLSEYGGTLFDEDIMFQSLSTTLFREATGRLVTSRVLTGADFNDIAHRASQVKQRIPGAAVYATVGLETFNPDMGNSLHGVVLLDASKDTVTFHNPSPRHHRLDSGCTISATDSCGAFDSINKVEFIERWSASLHNTRLIISRPAPVQ